MKFARFASYAALATTVGCSVAFAADVKLENLVRSTKSALLTVENGWPDAQLIFNRVELSVGTRVVQEAQGEISFLVITLGGSEEYAASSTVTLTLRPPDPEAGSDVSVDPIADALAAAILSAANAVREAGRGQPPLEAARLEASIGFALVENAKGGISIDFSPVSVDLGHGVGGTRSHSIKAFFENPEDG